MKHTKKAIRQLVEDALQQVSLTLDLSDVSRKSRKVFQQASRDLSGPFRDDLKKKYKKEEKLCLLPEKWRGRALSFAAGF